MRENCRNIEDLFKLLFTVSLSLWNIGIIFFLRPKNQRIENKSVDFPSFYSKYNNWIVLMIDKDLNVHTMTFDTK